MILPSIILSKLRQSQPSAVKSNQCLTAPTNNSLQRSAPFRISAFSFSAFHLSLPLLSTTFRILPYLIPLQLGKKLTEYSHG